MFEYGSPFETPFEEAVRWFLAKGIVTREEFERLSAAERLRAFTAAHVHAADQLELVYQACLAAIAEGQTLQQFVAATENILASPWHRETVFRTNVLSAYGRGHWEQAQQVKELRPYARYSAVMDGRTRPTHAALHGLVYPLDHPFWKRYWPPWDYNCRCGAFTLTDEEITREGLTVQRELRPDLPKLTKFVSPSAGEWQPDYERYSPKLRAQVKREVQELNE